MEAEQKSVHNITDIKTAGMDIPAKKTRKPRTTKATKSRSVSAYADITTRIYLKIPAGQQIPGVQELLDGSSIEERRESKVIGITLA